MSKRKMSKKKKSGKRIARRVQPEDAKATTKMTAPKSPRTHELPERRESIRRMGLIGLGIIGIMILIAIVATVVGAG